MEKLAITPASSLPTSPAASSKSLSTSVAERTGEPVTAVEFVASAYYAAIRRGELEYVTVELTITVVQVAQEYGARQELPKNVLKEACNLVLSKFSHLAVHEIREAYRQWAAGEITVDKKGEMYGGEFNASQLGAVLKAYAERRRNILAEYLRQAEAAKLAAAEQARTAHRKAQFEQEFPALVERVRSTAKTWQDVPEYLFHALRKRGYLKLPQAQADAIFQEAARLADLEIEAAKQERRSAYNPLPDPHQLRITIARKLAFWQLVVEDQDFKIQTTAA